MESQVDQISNGEDENFWLILTDQKKHSCLMFLYSVYSNRSNYNTIQEQKNKSTSEDKKTESLKYRMKRNCADLEINILTSSGLVEQVELSAVNSCQRD